MALQISGVSINGRTSFSKVPEVVNYNWAGFYNAESDRLSTIASSQFAFGTGNFTSECWVNISTGASDNGVICLRNNSSGLFDNVLAIRAGFLSWSNGASWTTANTTVPLNQWVHVAAVRNSGTVRLYQNGVQVASVAYNAAINGNRPCVIGNFDAFNLAINGYISNVRVVADAVYTSAFTPPTTGLTAITGTRILTLQNSTLIDNSANNFSITNNSVTITEIGPF